MLVTAKSRHLRIAPRKVRLVADLIRGKKVEEAQSILNFTIKKGVTPLLKLLKSATANAKQNFGLEESNLYISKITVDEGPKLKRLMPRARGQPHEIQKKTSHVTVVLSEIEKRPKEVKKVEKVKKIEKIERVQKPKKAKLRPELETPRPKIERGARRIFSRKAF